MITKQPPTPLRPFSALMDIPQAGSNTISFLWQCVEFAGADLTVVKHELWFLDGFFAQNLRGSLA